MGVIASWKLGLRVGLRWIKIGWGWMHIGWSLD
jgi:hypothetical protein